ncbi:MAG TPA: hypothetical protein VE932_21140 [Patescibacteria group bacterium]|nr:hypothetical protein [Patescibacteria group bacterium]
MRVEAELAVERRADLDQVRAFQRPARPRQQGDHGAGLMKRTISRG